MKKALIVGCGHDDAIAQAQREPFIYHKKSLHQKLNLNTQHIYTKNFAEMARACQQHDSDVVFLLPHWHEPSEIAEKAVKSIRENNPDRTLVFVDPFAQTSTKYFNLLPYVDRFLKRQCLADIEEYYLDSTGGSTFTEFVFQQWQADFSNWFVGSKIPDGYQDRITSGWNLGTAKKYKQQLQKPKLWWHNCKKNIDVFCRLSLGSNKKKEWYCEYRLASVKALEPLQQDYKLAVSGRFIEDGLIPGRQYLREIKSSRIVFSPFGWGENCWRDFEAICYDCLLIKPSMSHIDTKPNIFIPEETYVPVKWDFSDLEEKCRYYLEHPEAAQKIVDNARCIYKNYFEHQEFVETIERLIAK